MPQRWPSKFPLLLCASLLLSRVGHDARTDLHIASKKPVSITFSLRELAAMLFVPCASLASDEKPSGEEKLQDL